MENQLTETKRRRLPYLKSKHKSGTCPDSSASLADILQYYGEKGAFSRVTQHNESIRLLASLNVCPVDTFRKKIITLEVQSKQKGHNAKAIKTNDNQNDCNPLTPYSTYMKFIMNFIGKDIGHLVAPNLPCLRSLYVSDLQEILDCF